MRINKKRESSTAKKITIVAIVTLLLAAGAYAYYYSFFRQSAPDSGLNKQTESSSGELSDKPNDVPVAETGNNEADEPTPQDGGGHTPKKYEGTSPNSSSSLTGVINYKNILDNSLVIRTTIDQSSLSGQCTLKLSNGTKTITQTAEIVANPSSSTCKGFSVPTSQLKSGTWSIEIGIKSNDGRQGTFTETVKI